MFGLHMQCIVMPACPQKMLPAANNSLKHVTGRCTLHVACHHFSGRKPRLVACLQWPYYKTMHCICTPNKMTPVCASELPSLCLLDSCLKVIGREAHTGVILFGVYTRRMVM